MCGYPFATAIVKISKQDVQLSSMSGVYNGIHKYTHLLGFLERDVPTLIVMWGHIVSSPCHIVPCDKEIHHKIVMFFE